MTYLLVHHRVEDYGRWKSFFDGDAARRQQIGSTGARVFCNAADPNDITVIMQWDSMASAQQMVQSPELREVMQQAGVLGPPEITFLEEVDSQPA